MPATPPKSTKTSETLTSAEREALYTKACLNGDDAVILMDYSYNFKAAGILAAVVIGSAVLATTLYAYKVSPVPEVSVQARLKVAGIFIAATAALAGVGATIYSMTSKQASICVPMTAADAARAAISRVEDAETEADRIANNCPITHKSTADINPWTVSFTTAGLVVLGVAAPVLLWSLYAYGDIGLPKGQLAGIIAMMVAAAAVVAGGAAGSLFSNVKGYYKDDQVTIACEKVVVDPAAGDDDPAAGDDE